MQNTSVGPFRSGDAVCRVSAQGLARTLWLPTSHPVVTQCIRSYEPFCFFNFLSVIRHLLLHLTAGCAIVVLCRSKALLAACSAKGEVA